MGYPSNQAPGSFEAFEVSDHSSAMCTKVCRRKSPAPILSICHELANRLLVDDSVWKQFAGRAPASARFACHLPNPRFTSLQLRATVRLALQTTDSKSPMYLQKTEE